MKTKTKAKKRLINEVLDYDYNETLPLINQKKKLRFEDLGLKLPDQAPTQVISIRLPTQLVNEIKAYGSEMDVPYQALIKMFLSEAIKLKKA